MLSVIILRVVFFYHYDECHYAECRGAPIRRSYSSKLKPSRVKLAGQILKTFTKFETKDQIFSSMELNTSKKCK